MPPQHVVRLGVVGIELLSALLQRRDRLIVISEQMGGDGGAGVSGRARRSDSPPALRRKADRRFLAVAALNRFPPGPCRILLEFPAPAMASRRTRSAESSIGSSAAARASTDRRVTKHRQNLSESRSLPYDFDRPGLHGEVARVVSSKYACSRRIHDVRSNRRRSPGDTRRHPVHLRAAAGQAGRTAERYPRTPFWSPSPDA